MNYVSLMVCTSFLGLLIYNNASIESYFSAQVNQGIHSLASVKGWNFNPKVGFRSLVAGN
jgi:hypothetical protein